MQVPWPEKTCYNDKMFVILDALIQLLLICCHLDVWTSTPMIPSQQLNSSTSGELVKLHRLAEYSFPGFCASSLLMGVPDPSRYPDPSASFSSVARGSGGAGAAQDSCASAPLYGSSPQLFLRGSYIDSRLVRGYHGISPLVYYGH